VSGACCLCPGPAGSRYGISRHSVTALIGRSVGDVRRTYHGRRSPHGPSIGSLVLSDNSNNNHRRYYHIVFATDKANTERSINRAQQLCCCTNVVGRHAIASRTSHSRNEIFLVSHSDTHQFFTS